MNKSCWWDKAVHRLVLTKLNASVGRHIRFQKFVDTNFLFSLLDLHENPSNAATQELREIVELLKVNPRIELVITPETIEEAMLGSMRLPFLFQDFDIKGKMTSLKILNGIGCFEGSEGLFQDTITDAMFNDSLRSRLQTEHSEEAEIALIRNALVEEMRLRAEDEANKATALEEEVRKQDSDIVTLADQKRAIEEENAQTKKAKEEVDEAARLALASQRAELGDVKTRLQAMVQAELSRVENEQEDKATREKKAALVRRLREVVRRLNPAIPEEARATVRQFRSVQIERRANP